MLSGLVRRGGLASPLAATSRVLQKKKPLLFFSSSASSAAAPEDARVTLLVHAFRKHGHAHAPVNPIRAGHATPAIEPLRVDLRGLSESDRVQHPHARTVGELVALLQRAYCGSLTLESDHCAPNEAAWLANEFEALTANPPALSDAQLARFGEVMLLSQAFDEYLHRKLRMVKRYGLEGGEALMVAMEALFQQCAAAGIDDVVIGMPHRGRNNLLAVLLDYPAASMFAKMRGHSLLPPGAHGTDDVLSHIAQSVELGARYGAASLHVALLHNPSHLEAVDPVALGKARARQEERLPEPPGVVAAHERGAWPRLRDSARRTGTLCVQMHGDGAVAGQGVVAESALLARLPGYTTLGSIHVIVNNQVGFTCEGEEARSSTYASDVAKTNGSPVLRVNGEDPLAVARAAELAVRFRAQFGGDVWIDLICYRRHGHNELDEPAFTQPGMYAEIARRAPIAQQFAKQLVERGVWAEGQAAELVKRFEAQLDREYDTVGTPAFVPATTHLTGAWARLRQGLARDVAAPIDTGVAAATLARVAEASVALPADASVHRRLQKGFIEARRAKVKEGPVDYATAEALAFGSLMLEGHSVRLSGQDVQRGTFSHRHVVLTDQKTGARHCPLNANLGAGANGVGTLQAVQSPLSEFAVMGFEYGYSWQRPGALTLWEAQFGDFANTAQVIIDHFIASGEHKWLRQSGLVLLLPHGYDGAGPEHSSARIERFLQLSNEPVARDDALAAAHMPNWCVVNPTTPANYFHALRRQLKWPFRKPLIVIAPKTLIRLPECVSPLADMAAGTRFAPVLDDPSVADADAVTDVVLLSGKLYYDLVDERLARQGGAGAARTALVRLEQLAPFPHDALARVLARYRNARRVRWCQEEPQNQGAWTFVQPRVGRAVEYVGNPPLPASATGIYQQHAQLTANIHDLCFGPMPPGAVKVKKATSGGE